jgi:hypothetical protein
MEMVRTKEARAEAIAHLLDDVLRVPGTRLRMGVDPLLGLVPVIGDAIATLLGMVILLIARQLNVPWRIVAEMGLNQLKNGLIGAIPFLGDAYSFHFKSNAVNTALLLRAVKHGEDGTCLLTAHAISLRDIAGLAAMILPIVSLVAFISLWFWDQNISYLSLFFPAPYNSR